MKSFKQFFSESYDELEEQKMSFQDAEKLKNKHLIAMQHHKKSGNSKGYAAHSMVVSKFEDAYDHHGTGIIPAARILAASQKVFKDYPHSSMKEEVELEEKVAWSHKSYDDYVAHNKAKGLQVIPKDLWHNLKKNPNQPSMKKEAAELSHENLNSIAKDHDYAAKKHSTAYKETRSTAAARNHEVAYNRHVDAAKAHREAANDKSKHSSEKLEKMSNHAWDATDHIRKYFDEEVELDEEFKKGDIVKPTKGPHKGQSHEVIHDFGDGHYNVKPIGLRANQIRYSMGAAKAYKSDLVKEEVELEEVKKPKPGHNVSVMAKNISKVLAAIKKEELEND